MTLSVTQEHHKLVFCVNHAEAYWQRSCAHSLWEHERSLITPVIASHGGQQGLEFSAAPTMFDESATRHPIRWACSREHAAIPSSLVCHPSLLPLEDESIDVVVIHHLLEVLPQPHHLLGEAARVTADNGLLIIVGWNPLGTGALDKWCAWQRQRHLSPQQCAHLKHQQWRSVSRLKDWLAFVDFEVKQVNYVGFTTSFFNRWRHDGAKHHHALPLGRSYILIAKRKQWRVIPLQSRLSSKLSMGIRTMGLSAGVHRESSSPSGSHHHLKSRKGKCLVTSHRH